MGEYLVLVLCTSTLHSSNSTTFNVGPVGKATLPLSAMESTEEEVTGKNDRSVCYVMSEACKAWKRWLLCRCKSMQRVTPSSLLRTFSATLGSWRSTLKADRGSRSGQSVSDKQSTLKSTLQLHSSNSTTFNVGPVGKATLPLSAMESTEEEVTGKNDRSVCYVNDASQPSTFNVHALQQCPVEEEEVFYYFY